MSPKVPCVKGMVSSLWRYWEVAEPLNSGALWEVRSLRGDTSIMAMLSLNCVSQPL